MLKTKIIFVVFSILITAVFSWHAYPRFMSALNFIKEENRVIKSNECNKYLSFSCPNGAEMINGFYCKDSIDYKVFMTFKGEDLVDKFSHALLDEGWVIDYRFNLNNYWKYNKSQHIPDFFESSNDLVNFAKNKKGDKHVYYYNKKGDFYLIEMDL